MKREYTIANFVKAFLLALARCIGAANQGRYDEDTFVTYDPKKDEFGILSQGDFQYLCTDNVGVDIYRNWASGELVYLVGKVNLNEGVDSIWDEYKNACDHITTWIKEEKFTERIE